MQDILAVTIPFFALVLTGYVAADRGALPASAIPGLNAFVLYFALPCMLFRFGIHTPLMQLFNPAVIAVYAVAALVIVAFTITVTKGRRVRLPDAAFGALLAAFPNTGFMGVPLLVALLGAEAAGPVICTILVDLFLTSSGCIALARGHAAASGGGSPLGGALRGALSNPLPWSIALGGALGATGLQPSGPLMTVIGMLADAASPVALFTIGAVLWRAGAAGRPGRPERASATTPPDTMQLHTRPDLPPRHRRTPPSRYLPVALIKLLLHPLLVLLLAGAGRALGLPLSPFQIMVLTLAAALPSASAVSPLAERFGIDNGRIARIILSSTVLAFASFTLLAWALGVGRNG